MAKDKSRETGLEALAIIHVGYDGSSDQGSNHRGDESNYILDLLSR